MVKTSLKSVKCDFLFISFCNTCGWEILWKYHDDEKLVLFGNDCTLG
jgi:hypothetical protein